MSRSKLTFGPSNVTSLRVPHLLKKHFKWPQINRSCRHHTPRLFSIKKVHKKWAMWNRLTVNRNNANGTNHLQTQTPYCPKNEVQFADFKSDPFLRYRLFQLPIVCRASFPVLANQLCSQAHILRFLKFLSLLLNDLQERMDESTWLIC